MSGVPLGSIPGPILFSIFVRDMDISKPAEDTKLSGVTDTLKERAASPEGHCKAREVDPLVNLMKFNTAKSKIQDNPQMQEQDDSESMWCNGFN